MRWRLGTKRRGWKFYVLVGLGVTFAIALIVCIYFYISFSRMIDARLHGETAGPIRASSPGPFELRRGQSLTPAQLVDRLNDLGYSHRAKAEQPGEFTVGRDAVVMIPRDGDRKGQLVRIVFAARGREGRGAGDDRSHRAARRRSSASIGSRSTPPLITALVTEAREKRRDVPLAAIPPRMVQAVLAIEDRRFYDHPGIDPIGIVGAVVDNSSAARSTCAAAARSRSSSSRTCS